MCKGFLLVVDNGTCGYTRGFEDINSLSDALKPLLDEQLIEVRVKRKETAKSNSLSDANY